MPHIARQIQRSFREFIAAPTSDVAVYLTGGTVAGYLSWYIGPEDAMIHAIGVREEHRRRGIARAFLKAVLEDMRQAGAESVYGVVWTGNDASHRLFRTQDFSDMCTTYRLGLGDQDGGSSRGALTPPARCR